MTGSIAARIDPSSSAAAASALRRCEQDDPGWHRVHLGIALLWAFSQGISTSIEGVTWGLLAAVSLLRLPHTQRTISRPLRDPAWLLLAGWQLWLVLSATWAVPGAVEGWSWLRPYRWLITPLLLWPVFASRPWVLLSAMAAGAVVQTVAILAEAWDGERWSTYTDLDGLLGFGSLIWILGTASVIGFGSLAVLRRWGLLLGVAVGSIGTIGVLLSASRAMLIGIAISLALLMLRPCGTLRGWRLLAMSLVAIVAVAASGWLSQTPAWTRIVAEFTTVDGRPVPLLELHSGSHRIGLWVGTWEIILDRPLLGSGRGSFPTRIGAWADATLESTDDPGAARAIRTVGRIQHPHNMLMNTWVEGGIPAVLLLGGGLFLLTRSLWRSSAQDAAAATALGLLAIVLVGAMLNIAEHRAPGALLAVAMLIHWAPRDP